MSSRRTLKGRRIAVLAADGFEKVELTVPLRALRAAGAKVDVVSLTARTHPWPQPQPAGHPRARRQDRRAGRRRRLRRPPGARRLHQPGPAAPVGLGARAGPRVRPERQARRHAVPRAVGARLGRGPRGPHPDVLGRHQGRRGERRGDVARPGGRARRQPHDQQGTPGHGGVRPRDARHLRRRAALRDALGHHVRVGPAAEQPAEPRGRSDALVAEAVDRRRGRRRPGCAGEPGRPTAEHAVVRVCPGGDGRAVRRGPRGLGSRRGPRDRSPAVPRARRRRRRPGRPA